MDVITSISLSFLISTLFFVNLSVDVVVLCLNALPIAVEIMFEFPSELMWVVVDFTFCPYPIFVLLFVLVCLHNN